MRILRPVAGRPTASGRERRPSAAIITGEATVFASIAAMQTLTRAHGARFREGLKDGTRVLMRYQPAPAAAAAASSPQSSPRP